MSFDFLVRVKNTIHNQDKKSVVENFFSLSFLNFFNYVLPLFTIPYLVRILGPDKYGLVAFSQYFVQYFIIITEYGFNLSATNRIARFSQDKNKISEIFYSVLFVKFILAFLSFFILLIFTQFIPRFQIDSTIYFYAFGAVIGSVLFPVWFFQGIEKMKYITFFNVLSRLFFTFLIFFIIKTQSQYLFVPLITSISSCFSGVVSLIFAITNNRIKLSKLNWKIIAEELKEGWAIFVATLATSIYNNGSAFILGLFTSNTIVGYYAGADKIIKVVQNSLSPITQSIFPYVSKITSSSKEKTIFFIQKLSKILLPLVFVISIFTLIFAPLIVNIILGKDYTPSINILRILAFIPTIVTFSNLTGIQLMVPLNFRKQLSIIYITAACLSLILALILIPPFKALGLAVVVLIIESFVAITQGIFLKKKGIRLFIKQKILEKQI